MVPQATPDAYPASAEQWVDLGSGDRIFIRPIIPEDVERIAHAFESADIETIRRRFFTAAPPTDRGHLEYLANVDYVTRCALVAIDERGDSIGIGRYESTGVGVAEVAIVVEESWRHKHVGSLLLSALEPLARDHGITEFHALYLPENKAVDKLLASLGYGDRLLDESVVVVTKALD